MPPLVDRQYLLRVSPRPSSADSPGSIWAADVPTWITGIGTTILAIFAIYAIRAFAKQSQEVSDQANMLQVQSGQLTEQRKVNEKQIEVLELQAAELREATAERRREAEQRHRAQASRVFITQEAAPTVFTTVAVTNGPTSACSAYPAGTPATSPSTAQNSAGTSEPPATATQP